MATTRFYLDLRGKAKDGKGSLLIFLYHNFTSASIPIGIRVYPDEWDNSAQIVVKRAGAEAINVNLQEKKYKIDKAIAVLSLNESFDRMTAAEIKREIIEKKARRPAKHNIPDLFQEYVSSGNLRDGTKEIYNNTLKKVVSFSSGSVKIEDIDYIWVKNFDRFLAQTQGVNGRSIYLRAFRAVCNYARRCGIQFNYPFDSFKIKAEPTRKRSVELQTMRNFLKVDTNPKQERYRDYFLLMFYLIGINAKDLLLAKKTQVSGDRLEYIRAKTHKSYSIKIEPEAKVLLDKYSGEEYLLDAMERFRHYKNYLKALNSSIQSIGEIPDITTYYARHCWATFAYEIGISVDVISQAMGHSFGNRTTLIYIKQDQSKVDEANRRVIDYLNG